MKQLILALSIFFSISAFAANTGHRNTANESLICVYNDVSRQFQIDYSITAPQDKLRKLSEALIFEDYLHSQIRIENNKYDKLAMQRANQKSRSNKKFVKFRVGEPIKQPKKNTLSKKDLSNQYQVTMDLLSQAEALADYIDWLRS